MLRSTTTPSFAPLALLLVALAGAQASDPAEGLVTLPGVFSDHMVIQRGEPIVVWGEALPGTEVEVAFAASRAQAVAADDGSWSVRLPAVRASRKGKNLRIRATHAGHTELTELHDVVCGDVWFCSGQSNMRWRVQQAADAAESLEWLDASPRTADLRLIDFEGALYPDTTRYGLEFLRSLEPESYYRSTGWSQASRESVATFSAVAFAFGRALIRDLDVPIGLVHNAIGGSPMEAWLPSGASHLAPELSVSMDAWWTDSRYPSWCVTRARENLAPWLADPTGPRPHHPFEPSFLFDAGVAPLSRFAVRGVVWYQGESNASDAGVPGDPVRNRAALTSLIATFRESWGKPDLPIYLVQLPGMARPWAPFRETQMQVARETPGVETAVIIDLGHPTDVHPKRKTEVGERLARLALAKTYGRAGLPSGPLAGASVGFEGSRARVRFENATGLRTSDGEALRGFELAGEGRVFVPALAAIEGDEVVVTHADVTAPVAVRYAFADDPDGNLINAALLPASPFRSDRWAEARRAPLRGTESFETMAAGPVRELELPVGRFRAAEGQLEVTGRFARTGRQCLHLRGGEDRSFTLELATDRADQLSFWAERWTRRAPFEFRIEARQGEAWVEIWSGDDSVRVGSRLLSHVQIPLPAGTRLLRFRSTSPAESGVLIDDLSAGDPAPMRWVGARHDPWVAPALHGQPLNPVTKVGLRTRGRADPLVLTGCRVSLPERVRLEDLARVSVHLSPTGSFDDARPFGEPLLPARDLRLPARDLLVRGRLALGEGEGSVWIAVELAEGASLDGRVAATCEELHFEDGSVSMPTGRGALQRIGVLVRAAGQGACHTYRIPGLATTKAGTLIAVYDARYRGSGDLPGDIDVGMCRSADGGRTWSPMRAVMDMGDDSAWAHDGIGDPSVLVDGVSGTIWVAATWSHGQRSWNGSGPGLAPEETGQLMLVRSDDDGLTWSEPINITRHVKLPEWRFVLAAPGAGITMSDGTLVFPAQYRSSDDSEFGGRPFSTLIHSKDRGETWGIGTGVKVDTTECQVVELDDGELMINCRDNRRGSRSVYTTRDLGASWRVHPTSRSALPEPTCMASLLRFDHPRLGRTLVFSNPACRDGRRDMTIKLSRDDGRTWPAGAQALFDQRVGFGYSCLAPVDDRRVGVLYEGRRELYFVRFDLDELTGQ